MTRISYLLNAFPYLFRSRLSAALIFLLPLAGTAQLNFDFQKGKFLVKGKVVDIASKGGIGMANIRFNSTNRGYTTDSEGSFTFYVYPTDTLRFSCAGYIPKTMLVSEFDSTQKYTLEIALIRDFVKLKEVTIYPFRNREEFIDAFIDAKDVYKVNVPGIAPPKYSNEIPRAKLSNPISFLYERAKKRSSANPDFRP